VIPPRIESFPPCVSSLGQQAVELSATAGLVLDDWQAYVLEHSLGVRSNGLWAARDVGLMVPRQNGKGGILEARMLASLFLVGDRLVTYSAHLFDTSTEALDRMEALLAETPKFSKRVKSVVRSHGLEGIRLLNGQRIRFRTRTKGGGRGFSGETLILDEAQYLPELAIRALGPTQAAQRNPQAWYVGTPVDQFANLDGEVFARVRRRAFSGTDPALAYFEWSIAADGIDSVTEAMMAEEALWEQANPAIDIRISREYISNERGTLGPHGFAQERLGVGDWPTGVVGQASDIDLEAWARAADPGSKPRDPVCFAFDVTPRRTYASIAVAGFRADGLPHVEIVDRRPGTGWVPQRLEELVGKHRCSAVAYAKNSPAESLIPDVELLPRVSRLLVGVTTAEHAAACGRLFDLIEQRAFRHMGVVSPFGAELDVAVAGAFQKEHGDKFLWSRSKSAVDISPLVAATLALYEVAIHAGSSAPMVAFA
jgi:hypothetical protein